MLPLFPRMLALALVLVTTAPRAQAPAPDTVGSALDRDPIHTFARAVAAAGLTETLSGAMPVTVYAPSDAAFQAMPQGTLDSLMKPENKDLLKEFLQAHIVWGTYDIAAMKRMDAADGSADVPTVGGTIIHFRTTDKNQLTVTDTQGIEAAILPQEIPEKNGVIEVIDTVLAPPERNR